MSTRSKVFHQKIKTEKKNLFLQKVVFSCQTGSDGLIPNLRGPVPCSEQTEFSLTFLPDWPTQRGVVSREKNET